MPHPIMPSPFWAKAHRTRSAIYLGGCVAFLELALLTHDQTRPYSTERLHIALLPVITGWTMLWRWLEKPHRLVWHTPSRQVVRHIRNGMLMGSLSFGGWLVIARGCGWATLPAWGWIDTPPQAIWHSIVMFSLGNAAIVWNEEQIFRGYGFESLAQAVGTPLAATILTILFALAHGGGTRRFMALSALGTTLFLIRLRDNGIAGSVGYHWASNIMQTAVFGNPTAEPSLYPLHVHGPAAWVGRPGTAEGGWLDILVSTLVNIVLAGLVWQRRRTSPSAPHHHQSL